MSGECDDCGEHTTECRCQYPQLICDDCAKRNKGLWPEGHIGSICIGRCGWCLQIRFVGDPRDWGYPKYVNKIKKQ